MDSWFGFDTRGLEKQSHMSWVQAPADIIVSGDLGHQYIVMHIIYVTVTTVA